MGADCQRHCRKDLRIAKDCVEFPVNLEIRIYTLGWLFAILAGCVRVPCFLVWLVGFCFVCVVGCFCFCFVSLSCLICLFVCLVFLFVGFLFV